MTTTAPGAILIGVGELLWDCFPDSRRPGGAPANVAYHAAQLGCRARVCSRVGTDAAGDELLAYLAQRGLDTRWIQRDRRHPTGTVIVHAGRPDAPAYSIHENVAWDYLRLSPEWEREFSRADAVCFGTLAQRSSRSRSTIRRALRLADEALLVYDVNLRPPFCKPAWMRASIDVADVVKLNDQEAPPLAELYGLAFTGDLADFARTLLAARELRAVCVTRGAAGCLLAARDEIVDIPGRPVEVVDTVGAGDAFTAALTCGLLERWPLALAAKFANEVGGLVASRAGAMPDLREELLDLKRRLVG